MRRLALVAQTARLRSVEVDILVRHEGSGRFFRGITGCRPTKEARVTEGSKMPSVVVADEEAVEEEEVVTVHMLAGRDDTTRCCDHSGRTSVMLTGWTG